MTTFRVEACGASCPFFVASFSGPPLCNHPETRQTVILKRRSDPPRPIWCRLPTEVVSEPPVATTQRERFLERVLEVLNTDDGLAADAPRDVLREANDVHGALKDLLLAHYGDRFQYRHDLERYFIQRAK